MHTLRAQVNTIFLLLVAAPLNLLLKSRAFVLLSGGVSPNCIAWARDSRLLCRLVPDNFLNMLSAALATSVSELLERRHWALNISDMKFGVVHGVGAFRFPIKVPWLVPTDIRCVCVLRSIDFSKGLASWDCHESGLGVLAGVFLRFLFLFLVDYFIHVVFSFSLLL